MVRLVPSSLREAALALGIPEWKVLLRVVLPTARAGIITGVMVAIARVAGETAPLLRTWVQPFLGATLGFLPLFQGPPYGVGMLAAGIILAIMVVPFITAVSREVLLAVPNTQREAALALGATRWETTRMAVLRYGRSGLVGAILLGLGRALGETMAVTMVIGNRPEVALSLFAPGYTMASVIANEFTEATSDLYLSALIEIGLLLFVVTVIVNALARLLVWSVGGPVKAIRE